MVQLGNGLSEAGDWEPFTERKRIVNAMFL